VPPPSAEVEVVGRLRDVLGNGEFLPGDLGANCRQTALAEPTRCVHPCQRGGDRSTEWAALRRTPLLSCCAAAPLSAGMARQP
jgi:hypothetical protein